MNRGMLRVAAILLSIGFVGIAGAAGRDGPVVTVSVNVTIADAGLKAEITSYLTRALRRIADIEVVPENRATFQFICVAVKTEAGPQHVHTGYALSFTLASRGPIELALQKTARESSSADHAVLSSVLKLNGVFETSVIMVMNTKGLAENCEKWVNMMDGTYIEAWRKVAAQAAEARSVAPERPLAEPK